MSKTVPSRSIARGTPQPTLADLLAAIEADAALDPRRRTDMASAVRAVARAVARPPAEVPAHAGRLRAMLKDFAPAAIGMGERRWANALSLTRAAFEYHGLPVAAGRSREPFAPEWSALFRPLAEKHTRLALSRLARFCGDRGIPPGEVDDAVFAAYGAHLEADALTKLPRKVHRKAAVVWNRAAASVPAWPGRPVAVPDHSRTFVVPWERFPAGLKADVDAYLAHLAGEDPLGELDRRPLRPASVRTRRHQLHAFLSAQVHRGRDPAALRTLADAVSVDAAKEGLRFFIGRDGSTKQAHTIVGVIAAVARHWVRTGPDHLATLDAIRRRLDVRQPGITAANRERLRQFDDPDAVRRLLGLPDVLMAEAGRAGAPPQAAALLAQTAVAVEILLMVPLRRGNLAGIDLGRHLVRSRGGSLALRIPGEQVKNSVDVDAPLPPRTARMLDRYLAVHRPVLLAGGPPSPYLFPGPGGRPKSRERLALQVTDTIRARCGLRMHLHLFRHLAAKLYLDAHPGAYGVVRLLHGHRSVATTTRFYCGLEAPAAVRRYDEHVLALREALAGPAAAGPRKGRQP